MLSPSRFSRSRKQTSLEKPPLVCTVIIKLMPEKICRKREARAYLPGDETVRNPASPRFFDKHGITLRRDAAGFLTNRTPAAQGRGCLL
jgi:hypothetical protein